MKIREPKPPGTLWATMGLLKDSFTFIIPSMLHTHSITHYQCYIISADASIVKTYPSYSFIHSTINDAT
jgi:hypothetical protein